MDGVRRGGDGCAMDVAGKGPLVADDCQRVARAQRCAARDRGRLSVHARQAGLPSRVPLAARLSLDRMAQRTWGRCADGSSPGPLLPRLLLGADGVAVCRRRDESAVDRRAHLLVAMEKLAPRGEILARVLGALMIVAGAVRLIWRAS